MSMTVSEFKDNLTAMLHGGTLSKVRNIESALQRAASTMLAKIDPIDTIRLAALTNTIHDDVFNYTLPSDFKKIIDLYPQDRRNLLDSANRNFTERFDLRKKLVDKTISIEGSEGSKIIRINWRSHQPKTLNGLDTLTANGTWAVVAGATGLVADDNDYVSGSGSIRVDLATTGDGIQNTSMTQVDLTDEDEVGSFFLWVKIPTTADLAKLTSISLVVGNDTSANYWTLVAQTTQADGTALKAGWNEISFPWSTGSETGTVDPATIDSLKVTFTITSAILNVQVDNITCSIGRNFDVKYYSKFVLKDTAGTWITKTTSDDDTIILDNDGIQIYLLETLSAIAHQIEGSESTFDISWAKGELDVLYKKYKSEYPSMSKKPLSYYGSTPNRNRW